MRPQAAIVRIDPALNRAIDFAIGEGLMKKETGNRITLTNEGIKRADLLIATDNIFVAEKAALSVFGKSVTEAFVNKLFSGKE